MNLQTTMVGNIETKESMSQCETRKSTSEKEETNMHGKKRKISERESIFNVLVLEVTDKFGFTT